MRGGTYDPYPSLSVATPPLEEKSPLESGSNVGRRRKKWKFDNSKYLGQVRAAKRLDVEPKPVRTLPDVE